MAARSEYFRSHHLPVLSAEQNNSQPEEINVCFWETAHLPLPKPNIKQLLDEVFRDIQNYQGRGKCYQPKPKAEADNT